MGTFRKLLLWAIALVLILVSVLTWGSIGSIVMVFCLILMAAALLFQRFLNHNDADDFRMEE